MGCCVHDVPLRKAMGRSKSEGVGSADEVEGGTIFFRGIVSSRTSTVEFVEMIVIKDHFRKGSQFDCSSPPSPIV